MSNLVAKPVPRPKLPAKIAKLLGQPVLFRGESREQYDDMLIDIGQSAEARDVIDWLSVSDMTYHVWQHRRLQQIKAAIITNKQIEIIEGLLKTTYDDGKTDPDVSYYLSGARNEARRWASDVAFAAKIDARLAARGHDPASILAKAYSLCATALQNLDKAIADCEARRMGTLREIYRRDEFLARRLEKTSQQVIEGEFSEAAE